MEKIQSHLMIIFKNSLNSIRYFVNKEQNEVDRFIFCAIEKLNKISIAFIRLYPQLDNSQDLEFSLEILARSVLMDMILVLNIKKVFFKYDGKNLEEIKEEVKELCYKFISDGTNHLIEEIHQSEILTDEEKKAQSNKFASLFNKAFDINQPKPKLKKDYRVIISELYKQSEDEGLVTRQSTYNLYSFYSKYDHLSHWTSLSGKISFESKKEKLNLSIILMVMHLRDLFAIAQDFDETYKTLESFSTELQKHLQESYSEDNIS